MNKCEVGMIPGFDECNVEAVDTIEWHGELYNVCKHHQEVIEP